MILGAFCLGMNVLAWYLEPNGIENKIRQVYSYPTGIKNSEILIIEWHKRKTKPLQTLESTVSLEPSGLSIYSLNVLFYGMWK